MADVCGKSDSTPEDVQRLAVAVSQGRQTLRMKLNWIRPPEATKCPSPPRHKHLRARLPQLVDVLSAEAAEAADEAQAGADKAHATCADLLSSFNILVGG